MEANDPGDQGQQELPPPPLVIQPPRRPYSFIPWVQRRPTFISGPPPAAVGLGIGTASATAAVINPALTELTGRVLDFADTLRPFKEALDAIAADVLGDIDLSLPPDALGKRITDRWDEERAAQAEGLLEGAGTPADLAEQVIEALVERGGLPVLDDRSVVEQWVTVVTWFLLCALAGDWLGGWVSGHRNDALVGLAAFIGLLMQAAKDLP